MLMRLGGISQNLDFYSYHVFSSTGNGGSESFCKIWKSLSVIKIVETLDPEELLSNTASLE